MAFGHGPGLPGGCSLERCLVPLWGAQTPPRPWGILWSNSLRVGKHVCGQSVETIIYEPGGIMSHEN